MGVKLRAKRAFLMVTSLRPTHVVLLGTTAGTTWRKEITNALTELGVDPRRIIDPRVPKGQRYDDKHKAWERRLKRNPLVLCVIWVEPGAVNQSLEGAELQAAERNRQMIGPVSMFEVGKLAYTNPHRTAVLLRHGQFQRGGRLKGIADELREDFGGRPPFFDNASALALWVAGRLTRS